MPTRQPIQLRPVAPRLTSAYGFHVLKVMNKPAEALTSGSRFVFWTLGPFLLFCFLVFGLLAIPAFATKEWIGASILTVLSLGCFFLFLSLLKTKKFAWAFRVVTALVAFAYSYYVIHEFFIEKEEVSISTNRAESTPWNAVLGFVVIGVPCYLITIFGMPRKKEESENQSSHTTPASAPR